MEFSCEKLLDENSNGWYKSLKFGGTPDVCIGLFGKANTKSLEKLVETYRIPKDERIAAHLTKKFLLVVDGVLFTENAIYAKPENCPEGMSNRIPWSELHQCFLVHEGITEAVCLYKPGVGLYILLQKTLVDTTSGNELVAFLQQMQTDILRTYPSLTEERRTCFAALQDECEYAMQTVGLSGVLQSALTHLYYDLSLWEDAAMLMASNNARTEPYQTYRGWILTLPEEIQRALSEKMEALWQPAAEELLRTLRCGGSTLHESLLRLIHADYRLIEEPSILEIRIRAALCEQLKIWNDVEETAQQLSALGLTQESDRLYCARLEDANREMRKIFEQIKNGTSKLSKEQLTYQDSMGLTPFHYALILGNQELISELFKSKNWPTLERRFIETDIYDLFSLAVYKDVPYEQLRKLLLRTDAGAIERKRAVMAAKAGEIAVGTMKVVLTASVQMAEKNGYCNIEPDQYQKTVEGRESFNKSSKNSDRNVIAAESELYTYLNQKISEVKQRVSQWHNVRGLSLRYVLHLYSDPEYLEKMLFHTGTWTLYKTFSGWHYMAPEGEIESHQSPTKELPRVEKPFVDSWFSKDAHENAEMLKKEFRSLAKKYHPDTSDHLNATEVFQEISAEYEQLQNNLNMQ